MIVTADHGFLYQNHDVSDAEWLSERPSGDAIWKESRRFVIGANLVSKPAFTTFSAARGWFAGYGRRRRDDSGAQCHPSPSYQRAGRAIRARRGFFAGDRGAVQHNQAVVMDCAAALAGPVPYNLVLAVVVTVP